MSFWSVYLDYVFELGNYNLFIFLLVCNSGLCIGILWVTLDDVRKMKVFPTRVTCEGHSVRNSKITIIRTLEQCHSSKLHICDAKIQLKGLRRWSSIINFNCKFTVKKYLAAQHQFYLRHTYSAALLSRSCFLYILYRTLRMFYIRWIHTFTSWSYLQRFPRFLGSH